MAYKDKSEAIRYNNNFNKQAYDRLSVLVPKGMKDTIQSAAKQSGESLNGFINRLICAELERLGKQRGGSGISPEE